nr:hypothetical protein CFP56_60428 [Quercus suber]
MASENSYQERQFPAPDARQKVDGFMGFKTGSPKDQESLQPNTKYNLRKSLAWDSAFFTSPGVLDPEELFQTLKLSDMGNSLDTIGNGEQKVGPSESLEAEKTSRTGECNLRKSLAWDSAFFTSAGVLEPEELSMMNKGFKKPHDSRPTPRIEEMWRSVESNSTVESDGSPLTSLEIDLFEDIRASAKISTQMKPTLPSRGKSITRHGLARVTSEASVPLQAQHGAGSGEFNPKHAARSKELHLSSSLKPPKISEKASQISRASLGANHVKLKTQSVEATSGHCLTRTKKPPLGKSSISLRRSITPPPTSLRTTGNSNVNLVATGSTYKTPPKYTTTNKTELEYSNYPTCLLSMSNSSSCTSPANSIDGSSLESLSFPVNQGPNNPNTSFDTTCREVLFDSNTFHASGMETNQPDEPHAGYKSQEKSPSIQAKKILAEINSDPSDVSRKTRPSGLRRPSPKIGFFDAETQMMPTVNQGQQFHSGLQSTLTKGGTGNNHDGASKRARYGKLQSPKTLRGTNKNMKIGSEQIRVSSPALLIRPSNPVQFEEAGNEFLEVSTFPGPMKDCFATTSRAQNNSPYRIRTKDCLKPKKVGNERHQAAELGLLSTSNAEDKGIQGFMKRNKQSSRKHEDASIKSAETNLRILHEDEKENLCGVRNRVDTYSRHIGATDIYRDVVIDLTKKRDLSFPLQHQ